MTSSNKVSKAVDVALADRAVKALLKHHESHFSEKKKSNLLGNDKPIQVQFSLEKVPENPSQKPIRILIPHPLYKVNDDDSISNLEEPSVCLIVKEESKPWVQEMIAQFPKEMGFVKKVLGLQSLRKKHGRFEQRRVLLSKYDVFMADDRILPMLAKSLGKEFFKAKKQPIPIALTRKQALPFAILQSLQATFLFISSGTTLTVRAATTAMTPKDILENIQAVVENGVQKIPGKWSNVRCIAIKTPASMSLPFYNKTPQELQLLSKMAGLEEGTSEVVEENVEEKKNAKRKLKEKSPLVQALKKQKKIESDKVEKVEMSKAAKSKSDKKSKNKKRSLSTEVEVKETIIVEKKQKEKMKTQSVATEIVVKETVTVEEESKKETFVASKKYKGSKKGYVFRSGKQGVGYYVDVKPVVDRMAMEALLRSARQQARGGGGRKKNGRRGRR